MNFEQDQEKEHDQDQEHFQDQEHEETEDPPEGKAELLQGEEEEEDAPGNPHLMGEGETPEDAQYDDENIVKENYLGDEEYMDEELKKQEMDEAEEMMEQPVQIETSKNVIKEVPKSEESSEYGRHYGLGEKRRSSGKNSEKKRVQESKGNNFEKKMLRDKSKQNLVEEMYSQKQVHKKMIGETLFASNSGKNTKVLQETQNLAKTKKTTVGKPKMEESKVRELIESSNNSEMEHNHMNQNQSQKSKNSEEQKQSLKEVDQNAEFLKFNENMYEILADNIEKIRESLRNMKKTNLSEEDQKVYLTFKELYIQYVT